jgi:hypothetical protein
MTAGSVIDILVTGELRLTDAGSRRCETGPWEDYVSNLRDIACLAFCVTIGACTTQPAPKATGSTASSSMSFGGRYEGSVQVSGAAAGGTVRECATNPRLLLEVTNNAFTYVQPHPNVANTSPSLTEEATTATYKATISSNGSIQGNSGNLDGTIQGTVSGSHMSGTITGALCYYTFTADRI